MTSGTLGGKSGTRAANARSTAMIPRGGAKTFLLNAEKRASRGFCTTNRNSAYCSHHNVRFAP